MAVTRALPQRARESSESGQAVVEYILLLSIVVSIYFTVTGWANSYGLANKLITPISKDFAATYQFGDPKASGFDSDSPKRHPRIEDCDECFRLFINPAVGGH
jgi:hypothetical protein